mmetsp:Transcript_5237/g.10458  ORF Transcript_5237/g.10458 Transcript_5237/m.10458 type:complete len:138 (+) Transcript_5237:787-1200(+)
MVTNYLTIPHPNPSSSAPLPPPLSFAGQSVAVGNLGMLSIKQGDHTTAKACVSQHLQLTQSIRDVDGECNAWVLLASVAGSGGDNDESIKCLRQASVVAEANGMSGMLKRINVKMGMAEANGKMEAHFAELAQQSQK